jgi:hypothetical protein
VEKKHRKPGRSPGSGKQTTIAMVARDWRRERRQRDVKFTSRSMGFHPYFTRITRLCSDSGADLVMFALWAHDERHGVVTRAHMFPRGTRHRLVVIAVTRHKKEFVEVWFRAPQAKIKYEQKVRRAADSQTKKRALVDEFDARTVGRTLLLICGESNIISTKAHRHVVDRYRVRHRLKQRGIQLVLNPVHSYMHRPEMRRKRSALSRWTHAVLSVWNRGVDEGVETREPWDAHIDGVAARDDVRELHDAIPGQPGIRIGIITVGTSARTVIGLPKNAITPLRKDK